MSEPVVLGVETSCDETGVAVVRGRELLSDVVASSMDEHARYGGIVPEVASRAHVDAIVPTVTRAAADANIDLTEIDAIAVTAGPGLMGSLVVGLAAAKALALSLGKPLYGVNHIIAHAAVDELVHGPFPDPTMALIVSGGHSSLLLVHDIATDVQELGSTLDDAAGEAFDKVGRVLGLPYPGGPEIDRLATTGFRDAVRFPRGLTRRQDLEKHPYDFSFSGLKTAVARWVEARIDEGAEVPVADVAASFQEAVVDVLVTKAIAACRSHKVGTLVVGGGFSANSRLRELVAERGAEAGIEVRVPPLRYCTDNGAMIASLGAAMVRSGVVPSELSISADSGMPLETTHV